MATATLTFEDWMLAVDRTCIARVGMSIHDLEDVDFADMFEEGDTPLQAVKATLRYAMGG